VERKYASSSVSLRLHAAGVERLCLLLGRGHAATARSQTHCAVAAVSVLGGAEDAEVPDAPAPATADTHGSGLESCLPCPIGQRRIQQLLPASFAPPHGCGRGGGGFQQRTGKDEG